MNVLRTALYERRGIAMKRLIMVAALALVGCGDAYGDLVSACQSSRTVKALSGAKAGKFCACQADMARAKKHSPEMVKALAEKWRGEMPKNVPTRIQGEWFVFQLQCLKKAGLKLG
jgi:hypothetical protein